MTQSYWPDADRINCPFAGSIAVSVNDLIWQDSAALVTTAYDVLPASSLTTRGSKAANQAYLAPRFMGVAKEALSASQTLHKTLQVDRVFVGPMSITSGTYYQGDLVTFTDGGDAGATTKSNKVEKTTTAADAIGFVLLDSGGAVTTVTVCLISRVLPKFMPTVSTTNNAGMTMDDGANIAVNTTTGTKIGTAAAQKLGFWNATPVVQPSGAAQAATSMTASIAAAVANGTNSTAWGFNTQAALNNVVSDLTALNTDVHALNTLLITLRANLVTVGIIKGSA